MLKLLVTFIILTFSQFAVADLNDHNCYTAPYISACTPSTLVADPGQSANCGINGDDDCATGYCGYFDDNSPINIPNMFGVLLNDWLDFGTPTVFLTMLDTVSLGTRDKEGVYVQLACPGQTKVNGEYDWASCPAVVKMLLLITVIGVVLARI